MTSPFRFPTPPKTAGEAATDDQLMQRMCEGEADGALGELFERHGPRIYRFCRGILGDDHLAQDVTQETFERVFAHRRRYRPGSHFGAWAYEIARNQCLSALRARKRHPRPWSTLAEDEAAESAIEARAAVGPDREPEERELMAALEKAKEDLPEHYRWVFLLCVEEELPYAITARLLGVPTGTVAIRLMRARRQLFRSVARHVGRLRRPPACFQ